MNADLIADLAIAGTSLIALWALGFVVSREEPRAMIHRRLLFAITLVAGLMAARMAFWSTGGDGFGVAVFVAAAWVPLAATLVVESLLERHAIRALKVWVAGGAVSLTAAAFVPWATPFVPLALLAGFQVTSFAALVGWLLARPRGDVSAAQNRVIDRHAFGLLLLLPLALSDFRGLGIDLPARMSGVAVLVFCVLSLSLRRAGVTGRGAYLSLGATVLASALGAGLVAALVEVTPRSFAQITLVLFCVALAAQAIVSASDVVRAQPSMGLSAHLARAPLDDRASYEAGLLRACAQFDPHVIGAEMLGDFDQTFFDHLAHHPGLSRAAPPVGDLGEQAAWFFDRFEASHAIALRPDARRILVLTVPASLASTRLDDEIATAQRLAMYLPGEAP